MAEPPADTRIATGPAGLVKIDNASRIYGSTTLFSSSSTMIPDHARMPVAQAPAWSERRSYIVKALFRHQSRYVQYVGQATRAQTL
jgi:hypothetical protein